MSDRGVEFVTTWVPKHINADIYPVEGDLRAEAYAKQCVADAETAGISVAEIEEDMGDIETYILEAMDDASDNEVDRLADKDG
jgi:hypothetical protein